MTPLEVIEFHRSMLLDKVRIESFRRAIASRVRHGDVVLDLGTGTGLLAVFAVQAGASRVYAVESDNVIELAKAVCRENGVGDRVVFINDLSLHARLPEPVDVIVSETIGSAGFDEGILGWLIDARERFLKPEGIIIPQSLEVVIAPVEIPKIYARLVDWPGRISDVDFASIRSFVVNSVHREVIEEGSLLGEPVSLGEVVMAAVTSSQYAGRVVTRCTRAGMLYGISGWFKARLSDDIELTNSPPNSMPSWNQVFFPIGQPHGVEEGMLVETAIQASNNGNVWRWNVSVSGEDLKESGHGAEKVVYDHSNFFGSMLSADALRRMAGDFTPELNRDGAIHRNTLILMDGKHPLTEIGRVLHQEFTDRFSDLDEAVNYARQVSAKFSEAD